jgi:hypothetical protein
LPISSSAAANNAHQTGTSAFGTKDAAAHYVGSGGGQAEERNVRRRVKALVLAAENVNTSPLLPAAAILLILLFGVSLAMADPLADQSTGPFARPNGSTQIAAHEVLTPNPFDEGGGVATDGGLATDAVEDAPIVSRPLQPPLYHDRYRFYHRYDHALRSQFNPIDDEPQ